MLTTGEKEICGMVVEASREIVRRAMDEFWERPEIVEVVKECERETEKQVDRIMKKSNGLGDLAGAVSVVKPVGLKVEDVKQWTGAEA